jgi:hypothetical protein
MPQKNQSCRKLRYQCGSAWVASLACWPMGSRQTRIPPGRMATKKTRGDHYGLVQLDRSRLCLLRFSPLQPWCGSIISAMVQRWPMPRSKSISLRKTNQRKQTNNSPCATTTSDRNGLAIFDQAEPCKPVLIKKATGRCLISRRILLVVAREGDDWSFVKLDGYSGAYNYGIFADWQGRLPLIAR